MNVYIGGAKDYSAMQGPAPSGFHVPLTTEWKGLKTIMDGLSLTTGDGWRINLHMPFAGSRDTSTASILERGSYGYYWSSSPSASSLPGRARFLRLDSSKVYADWNSGRSSVYSVRCFKDLYETPTSSWTIITGTLGSAGIFWNQSKGLISITNGTTGYTIQDKNLGATTVYNDGDTLTQANMGNMYRWGNNYGFPSTGTISNTSSTLVDASTYGPGNYYSSSTYITTGSADWSSVQNDNLRGGVTGIVSPAELKNAYIGEVYEYSYDFRGKSTTILTNDGWSILKGTPVFDSNGISCSGANTAIAKNIGNSVFANANKITMEYNFKLNSSSDTGFLICQTATSSSTVGHTGLYSTSGSNLRQTTIFGTTTNISGMGSGTYTGTITLDLVGKTYTAEMTGKTTQTGTLTDTQISNIRSNTQILRVSATNTGSTGVQGIKILVE